MVMVAEKIEDGYSVNLNEVRLFGLRPQWSCTASKELVLRALKRPKKAGLFSKAASLTQRTEDGNKVEALETFTLVPSSKGACDWLRTFIGLEMILDAHGLTSRRI